MMGDLGPWTQYGLAGLMLAWFMFRHESALLRQAGELRRMADSVLLVVLASPTAPATVRREAQRMLDDKGEHGETEG